MTLQSSAVSAGDTALATQYNNSRKDGVLNGGDGLGTVGGTADAITLTMDAQYVAYASGDKIRFLATGDNTGTTTVNVATLGIKTIKNADGQILIANEIRAGQWVEIQYDGTDFILTSVSVIHNVKGDLLVGTGSGQRAVLPAGAGGSFLVSDPSEASGLKWGGGSANYLIDPTESDLTAGTTTETDIASFMVPGGSLSTTNTAYIKLIVRAIDNNSGGPFVANTLTIRAKYGATTLASHTVVFSASIQGYSGITEFYLTGDGGTSAQQGSLSSRLLSSTADTDRFINDIGTSAEDSTGDLTVKITGQWTSVVNNCFFRVSYHLGQILSI